MDDNTQLEEFIQEAVKAQSARVARTIIAFLVAVTTGGAIFLESGGLEPVARPDPFTGRDGERLEERISTRCREHIKQEFKLHKLEPQHLGTRARLYHLEEWAERQDPAYKRPTTEW